MNAHADGDRSGWDDASWALLDGALRRFEQAWRDGPPPELADFVPVGDADPRFVAMLVELIRSDRECRVKFNAPKAVEAYLNQWPQLAGDASRLEPLGEHPTTAFRPNALVEERRDAVPRTPPPLRILCTNRNCGRRIEVVRDVAIAMIRCSHCGREFRLDKTGIPTEQGPDGTRRVRRMIEEYRIDAQLGAGAFGSVWKALDTSIDRPVAIKVPRDQWSDAESVKRFEREAKAAGALAHANVVTVHGYVCKDDLQCIIYAFIDGLSLSDWQTGERRSFDEIAQVYARIADGVHHAHQRGVIHRDLKPQNVLIDDDDHPHVTDFGLARLQAGDAHLKTHENVRLGTPAYMSPEQARGESRDADGRSDIYSLGAMLFESLTGELPFDGDSEAVLRQHIERPPERLRKIKGDVPRDLETICLRCLEKDPHQRYATAAELAAELNRFLNDEPIRTQPPSRPERVWRWCRRNTALAAVTATLLATLLVGAVSIGYWATHRDDESTDASTAGRAAVAPRRQLSWSPLGPLRTPRSHFGLVPLDGRLFAFGGTTDAGASDTAFFRHPAGNYFIKEANMPAPRQSMAYTLHSDHVYVVAGNGGSASVGKWGHTTDVWRYSTKNDAWSACPSLSFERSEAAAVSLDGAIYVIGGYHDEPNKGRALRLVERYTPNEVEGWTKVASLKTNRRELGAVAMDGKIYAIGGWQFERMPDEKDNIDTVGGWLEIYDPVDNAWTEGPPMPTPRHAFATAVLENRIYTIGGRLENGATTDTVEYFDIRKQKWFTDRPLPYAAMGLAAAMIDENLYVAGGLNPTSKRFDTVVVGRLE